MLGFIFRPPDGFNYDSFAILLEVRHNFNFRDRSLQRFFTSFRNGRLPDI